MVLFRAFSNLPEMGHLIRTDGIVHGGEGDADKDDMDGKLIGVHGGNQ